MFELSFIVFNCVKTLMILSGIFVLTSKNPVHSVLFLVVLFCNGAILLLLLQAEFLGLIYIVVYVGAIAVLFLFVVMMLNIKLIEISRIFYFLPVGIIIGLIFFVDLISVLSVYVTSFYKLSNFNFSYVNWFNIINLKQNLLSLGEIMYTYHVILFILCGFILLLAMLGSIILTLLGRTSLKRQDIYEQQFREMQLISSKY